jgi:hypothetical protein
MSHHLEHSWRLPFGCFRAAISYHGAAAMTSTSTKNSGRANPETIISVDAGGGSAM